MPNRDPLELEGDARRAVAKVKDWGRTASKAIGRLLDRVDAIEQKMARTTDGVRADRTTGEPHKYSAMGSVAREANLEEPREEQKSACDERLDQFAPRPAAERIVGNRETGVHLRIEPGDLKAAELLRVAAGATMVDCPGVPENLLERLAQRKAAQDLADLLVKAAQRAEGPPDA